MSTTATTTTPAPTVSVVMPAYNAADYLAEAIESVLAQTFGDFELIVINDGSTDRTREILASFERRDARVRVLDQPNAGVIESLNRGIREARGRYIARMDADDVCLPHRLAVQVAHLERHPDLALLGGFVATADETGRVLSPVVRFPVSHEELYENIGRRKWVMCHPAVVFRRDAAVAVGLYSRSFPHAEDTEFFARLMSRYRAENLPEVVLKYRLRRDAVCSRHRESGRVYARLVALMIDRSTPGQPFEPTPAELQWARTEVERLKAAGEESPRQAQAVYWQRIGRELLRGNQFVRAAGAFARAAWLAPLHWWSYAGIACALLRVGGTKEQTESKSAGARGAMGTEARAGSVGAASATGISGIPARG